MKSTRTPKAGATGPVTLAQARALAKVRAPLERGAKLALEPASPATVGLQRRKLEKKQELERRQRIKEYKATLAIMKKRGVKGLAPRAVKGGRAPKAAAGPLRCLPKATPGSTTPCRSSAAASSRVSRTSLACRS